MFILICKDKSIIPNSQTSTGFISKERVRLRLANLLRNAGGYGDFRARAVRGRLAR